MTTKRKASRWSLWGVPIVLAVVTAIGLIAALVGDGAWDAASWVALGLPLAVCAWFGLRARR